MTDIADDAAAADQHRLVVDQFGVRADAYVASAVHAAGPDLDWMDAQARQQDQGPQQDQGNANRRLLDIGCGGGHVSYRLSPHFGAVVASDPSSDMLTAVEAEAARRGVANIATIAAAAERLPFADAHFDVVASRFSAHHWHDLGAGLREAARVLRPGGQALFVDGRSPGTPLLDTHLQAIELLRDPSHVRDYATAEWLGAIEAAGFVPQEVRTARLRMDFASWTARMGTPAAIADAIRYLQRRLPADAKVSFGLEDDGSFQLDTIWIAARRR